MRNHLAVAVANVEAFIDGVLEPSSSRLTAVLQALHEVERLIRDLPDGGSIAHLDADSRNIDVCAVIANEVLGLEASAVERGVKFSVLWCEQHVPQCHNFAGDPMRVAEIVNNVVSNAIRYTPPGGRVEVDCRRAVGAIVLTVTDDGPGVSGQDIGHIFERGFRGSASRDTLGSGIGLTLAKRFVEQHGGSIDVHNVAKRGARFTVRLPGAAPAHVAEDGTISLV